MTAETINRPRDDERLGRQLRTSISAENTAKAMARRAIDEMLANGASFSVPLRDDGLASFTFEVRKAGDLHRCRAIIKEARQRADVWSAFVAEVLNGAEKHARSA